MKERQQSSQKAQEHRQEEQEKRGAVQKQALQQIPIQQFLQFLNQETLAELPVQLLRELAQAVGNSRLIDLMRGDGDGVAVTCAPEEPEEEVDLPPNRIRTSPPELTVPPDGDAADGDRPPPVRPRSIRDRGRTPEDTYAEISDRRSG